MARLFLALNGIELRFDAEEAIAMMLALAAADLSEEEAAAWFRDHLAAA